MFLLPQWRIITILLAYYEVAYLMIYFCRFKFNKAVRTSDKLYTLVSHSLLYIVPVIFLLFLYIGNTNPRTVLDVSNLPSILPLTHQLPESTIVNSFMEYIFIIFFLLAIPPLKNIFTKDISIRISYLLLIVSIIFKLFLSVFNAMDPGILILIDRTGLNITLDLFFISLFFVIRRSYKNECFISD
jgi:hypothetical protein